MSLAMVAGGGGRLDGPAAIREEKAMIEYVRKLATENAKQGYGALDMRNVPSQVREASDAAHAKAVADAASKK
jgi:hypothetical protein